MFGALIAVFRLKKKAQRTGLELVLGYVLSRITRSQQTDSVPVRNLRLAVMKRIAQQHFKDVRELNIAPRVVV